ncbi:hypothetical protein ACK3Y9_19880, partial [Aeromonas caviae]
MSPPPSSFLRGVPPPGQSDRTSLVTPLAATSLVRFSCDADSPVVFGLSAPQHAIKNGSSRDLGEVEVDRQGAGKLAVSKHTT